MENRVELREVFRGYGDNFSYNKIIFYDELGLNVGLLYINVFCKCSTLLFIKQVLGI